MSDDSRKIRFGLWYDFRNPAQWRQPADRLYREILDQIAWAENKGFDDVWLSVSISAEAGPGFSGQLGPIPAVEAVVPGVHGGDPRATRRALTSDGAARVGRRCGPPGSIRGSDGDVRCGS